MAASANAIRSGGAYVELFVLDRMTAGLRAAQARLAAFASAVTATGQRMLALGAAIAAPLAFAVKQFADLGSELIDMADRTGFTVEQLGELRFAAAQSGASFEDLENAIKFMQKGGFGNTAADLERIADEFKALGEGAPRSNRALEVFGKAGRKMIPLLKDGAAGIRALREEAQRLGLVMSTADAEAAEKFGDQMSALWLQFKMVVVTIGSAIMPALRSLVGAIQNGIAAVTDFIKENGYLVVVLGIIAADLVQTGVRMLILGPILRLLATAVGALTIVFTVLKVVLVGLMFILGGKFLIALAAIVGTAVGVSGAFSQTGNAFAEMGRTIVDAWGGISSALASGDLAGALDIAVAGVKVVWLQLVNELKRIWREFSTWTADNIFDPLRAALLGLEHAWLRLRGQGGPTSLERAREENRVVGMAALRSTQARAIGAALGFGGQQLNVIGGRAYQQAFQRQTQLGGMAGADNRIREIEQAIAAMDPARRARENQAAGREDRAALDQGIRELNDLLLQQWNDAYLQSVLTPAARVRPDMGATGDVDVAGTFSAAAAGGLGFGSRISDLLRENNRLQEENNRIVREIANQGGGVAIV